MGFFSLLFADLLLIGMGFALIGMFVFGVLLIAAAIIIKLVRRNRIKNRQPVYSKSGLLSNIVLAAGIICIAPFTLHLSRILLA